MESTKSFALDHNPRDVLLNAGGDAYLECNSLLHRDERTAYKILPNNSAPSLLKESFKIALYFFF